MKRIGILGAGTWGMALARMLTVSGNDVLVWSAIEKEIDSLSTTRKHPNLPQMPKASAASTTLPFCTKSAPVFRPFRLYHAIFRNHLRSFPNHVIVFW